MTQDMKKDTILHIGKGTYVHEKAQLRVPLKRTVSPLEADSHSAPGGHFFNRSLLLLLLMLFLGIGGAWGQDTDYSGTYCLANNNQGNFLGNGNDGNFYLCPSQEYYDNGSVSTTDNEKPFFTTYQTKQDANSLWVFEKVDGQTYYTIKLYGTNKYITVNDALTGYGKAHRKRIHLEELAELSDRNYFEITPIHVIDGVSGVSISCLDKYKSGNNKYFNPAGGNQPSYTSTDNKETPRSGGMVGFYTIGKTSGDDRGSVWFLEVPKPIINIDENFNLTFTCANEDLIIHYTIDEGDPSATGTDDIYNPTDDIQLSEGVHTIKAIAVMNSGNTVYASGVATYVVNVLSNTTSYLIQNVECTDFYMIPGDVSGSNTTVNTSSLFRSNMAWNFLYAGSENGFLYYYIKNGTSYLYHTNNGDVYLKTSSDFSDSDDGYKFSIEQGYDADSNTDGFHIVPKAKSSDNTYSIYKGGWGNTTLANSTTDAMKGSTAARKPEHKHTRWNFISAPDNKLPALLTYDSDDPNDANWPAFLSSSTATKYFKIENIGTAEAYMNPPADPLTGFVTATGTTGNDLAWYVVEADHNDWQKYYYIINASTGKYLKFNQTISDPPSSMAGKNNVLSLLDYDNSASDRYQFVFAKSTIDEAYYIVPKGLEDATYNSYYALYLDGTNPIKSNKNRASDSYKWRFVEAELFCNVPVFEEEEGVIKIKCNTNAAKIYINTESDAAPTADGSTLYNPTQVSQNWATNDQVRIKAIAVVSDGTTTASSSVVTLLNKPDITLASGSYTYKGTAWEPDVTSVSYGETIAPTTPSATYTWNSDSYTNNINVGTATVTLTDADASDLWYIWNASTTFTITPASVTLTANSDTKMYNGTEQTITGFTSSVNGLTFTGVSASGSGTNVGEYDVTFNDVTVNSTTDNTGNYLVTGTTNGTLTITPRNVTVKADDKTKTYGDADPELTVTITGLLEGDPVSSISYNPPTREDGEDVDTYAISVSSGESSLSSNYTVTFEPGTLTINKKELTVTAKAKTITYGDAPINDGVMYGAFAFEEDEDDLSGELTYTYNYKQYDDVGSGSFTITPGGLTSENYELNFVTGTLTVEQKEVEIGWSNTSLTYSGSDSELGPIATVTNKVKNDDDVGVTVTGKRTNAGTYNATAIASALTGDQAGNYKLPNPAPTSDFTINKARLMAVNLEKDAFTYNGGEQTVTITSVTAGDGTNVTIPVVPTEDYDVSGISATNAGTYNVTVTPKSPSTNYETSVSVSKSFTIGKKSIGKDNNTALADGFSVQIGEGNTIKLFDGETELTPGTDYTVGTVTTSGRYSTRTVSGTEEDSPGNYGGSAPVVNANVNFMTDGVEWSATFVAEHESSEVGHALPDGVTAYIIESIEGNEVSAKELNYIPKNVPVLLMSDEKIYGFLVKEPTTYTAITSEESEDNELIKATGTADARTFAAARIYLLYNNEFVLNKQGTLNEGEVYMLNPNYSALTPSPARLKIVKGGGTGIENIEYTIDSQSGAWYTLDGRRLSSKPTKKGLYLQSGKKIVVK